MAEMRRKQRHLILNGSITVYLTLILMLILSLVLTIIEGARISTAKVYAHRALTTAMDSVWAEYYRPLWEEYHIFGYDCGEGNADNKAGRLEEKLAQYMSYTFEPNMNLASEGKRRGLELYDIKIESLAVRELTGLMDYHGELFLHEAVEYMKYNELADGLTLLLEKLSMLESPKKVSVIYQDKLAAEQELAKADKSILRLMELLDGVRTTKKGIKLDRNGKLQSKDRFVKMLCSETISMENVSINHGAVFETVKQHYVNTPGIASQIKQEATGLDLNRQHILSVASEIRSVSSSLEAARSRLEEARKNASDSMDKETDQANSNTPNQEDIQSESPIQGMQDTVRDIEEQLNRLRTREQELRLEKQQLTSSVSANLSYFKSLMKSLIPIIEEADREIKGIHRITQTGAALVENFEESLRTEGESLDAAIRESLKKSLEDMKKYTSGYEGHNSMAQMSSTLEGNLSCLILGKEMVSRVAGYLEQENYSQIISETERLLDCLQEYEIRSLRLDYSSLILDRSEVESPVEQIADLIKNGIIGLVIPSENVSKKELTAGQLPSDEAALYKEKADVESAISGFFKEIVQGESGEEMGGLFSRFANEVNLETLMEDSINGMAEHLLYQEYLREHFAGYPTENTVASSKKPSVLEYELEYLLSGERSDRENLSSVLIGIILLRMILNFVTLLGDRTSCEEAKLAAAAVVGFTGLPMLINITQAIILLVWSFAEALTDTCVLLLGKEVPLLKQKPVLKLPEIFLMNQNFLKTKASAYTETGRLSFSYEDYLRGFLLMRAKEELIYRSMDLIQENLQLRYENDFRIQNCLFGLEAEAGYSVAPRFLALPIISRHFNKEIAGFRFLSKASYSY